MSKTFRAWEIDEPLLVPVTVREFVPKEHLARFLLSVVAEELDLGEITSCYTSAVFIRRRWQRCFSRRTAAASTARAASPRPAASASIS